MRIKRQQCLCLALVAFSISTTLWYIGTVSKFSNVIPMWDLPGYYFSEDAEKIPDWDFKNISAFASPILNESQVIEQVAQDLPHIPIKFLYDHVGEKLHHGPKIWCARLPEPWWLQTSNKYWQTVRTEPATFSLYAAYLDTRPESGPVVRALAKVERRDENMYLKCQIWFEGETSPVLANVNYFHPLFVTVKAGSWNGRVLQPYLLSCDALPQEYRGRVPTAVSFTANDCDVAGNALTVQYYPLRYNESRRNFGVCVQALNYPLVDLSLRLIEWIEVIAALGADKIFVYVLDVHPNMARVLEYYEEMGLIEVFLITLPAFEPNEKYLQDLYLRHNQVANMQNEVISLNDCLYRNLYRFKFLTPLDIDEVIVPRAYSDWKTLMKTTLRKQAEKRAHASYNFRNVYYMDDMTEEFDPGVPEFLHMMRHVYRSSQPNPPLMNVKSFHNTDLALGMHNHLHRGCWHWDRFCKTFPFDPEIAHLHHYRPTCAWYLLKSGACDSQYRNQTIRDDSLLRFRDQVEAGAKKAITSLRLNKRKRGDE